MIERRQEAIEFLETAEIEAGRRPTVHDRQMAHISSALYAVATAEDTAEAKIEEAIEALSEFVRVNADPDLIEPASRALEILQSNRERERVEA
jgi:hypothetical protein